MTLRFYRSLHSLQNDEEKYLPQGFIYPIIRGVKKILPITILILAGFLIWWAVDRKDSATSSQAVPKNVDLKVTEPSKPSKKVEDVVEIEVIARDFLFNQSSIEVKKGQKVRLNFSVSGGRHNLSIDEFDVNSPAITEGEEVSLEFTPDKAGEFEFYCNIGNHRALGMKGKLIVTE